MISLYKWLEAKFNINACRRLWSPWELSRDGEIKIKVSVKSKQNLDEAQEKIYYRYFQNVFDMIFKEHHLFSCNFFFYFFSFQLPWQLENGAVALNVPLTFHSKKRRRILSWGMIWCQSEVNMQTKP